MNELEKRAANAHNALNGWIDVKDQLPQSIGQFCDVWVKSMDNPNFGSRQTDVLFDAGRFKIDMYYSKLYVSHWMPIPEPPK